jgi:hypothetical protein
MDKIHRHNTEPAKDFRVKKVYKIPLVWNQKDTKQIQCSEYWLPLCVSTERDCTMEVLKIFYPCLMAVMEVYPQIEFLLTP